ncbi:MAG: hypothetical protein A2W19_14660 [Spirochaetes bacterium RBG_16_49_21]|nr:MAG: hypothetical protein A2W19_14660 [Spirochaetes bacterium RBG_16_49_21]
MINKLLHLPKQRRPTLINSRRMAALLLTGIAHNAQAAPPFRWSEAKAKCAERPQIFLPKVSLVQFV